MALCKTEASLHRIEERNLHCNIFDKKKTLTYNSMSKYKITE